MRENPRACMKICSTAKPCLLCQIDSESCRRLQRLPEVNGEQTRRAHLD